jgi:hypothetical protein
MSPSYTLERPCLLTNSPKEYSSSLGHGSLFPRVFSDLAGSTPKLAEVEELERVVEREEVAAVWE